MAVVRNITDDALALTSGATVGPGKEHSVPDEQFVDRAWPKSTWALVRKPAKGCVDVSPEDAFVFSSAAEDNAADTTPASSEESA